MLLVVPCLVFYTLAISWLFSDCKSFKEKFEEITNSLAEAVGESAEAVTAANLFEKLSVESKENEEKPEEAKRAHENLAIRSEIFDFLVWIFTEQGLNF